MVGIDRIV